MLTKNTNPIDKNHQHSHTTSAISTRDSADTSSFTQLSLRAGKLLLASGISAGLLAAPMFAQAESHSNLSEHASLMTDEANKPLPKLDSLTNAKDISLTLPAIDHFKTKSGIPVAFVQATTLPIVDVDIRFNAGSARDDAIRPKGYGIASMVASMLGQGTKQLDEEAFTTQVETLGVELNTNAFKDMFVVSLRSLSDDAHLTPAVGLMTQMLTSPRFDQAALERNKARLMVGLQQQQQDPGSIASIAFNEALYGDHPYAHQSVGTLTSVPSLTTKDLQAFKDRYLVAANATIAITGDLTLSQAQSLAETLSQNLPKGQPAPELPEPKPLTQSKRIHIPFDSTQTTVLMGQLGDKRDNSPAAIQAQTNFAIGNEVLAGGDFNARLMTEIRQKQGYTYGISGGMTPMLSRGPYQIGFSTRNEKANEAIDATLEIIKNTVNEGVNSKEVELTKDSLKNSFPMSFASNAGINGTLGMMNFYQLPDSYLANYLKRIDQASLTEINQTLKQKIDPSKFLIVTVGNQDSNQGDSQTPTSNTK